jgi:UDP-glucose 4-epimerase
MISVLVTGANTAIGRSVVQSLVADTRVGHVLAVDGSDHQLPPSSRLTTLCVDLTHARTVRELLFGTARDLGVEVIVHLGTDGDAHARGRNAHKGVEALRSILDLANRHPTIRRVVVRSFAVVYKVAMDLPILVSEDHPLNLSSGAPQYIRDRVEADLTACTRMGLSNAEIVVLRCAEALAPQTGSQLYDYLDAPLAFRPAGFDPMVNVATVADIVTAVEAATYGSGEGVFNIPGYDTLPLSACAHKFGTPMVPMPGPLVQPLYNLRHRVMGTSFSYGLNRHRMHFGLVLDGTRAKKELGYKPSHPVHWPRGRMARVEDMPTASRWS